MEDPEHVFSNGLYLANLAVSTSILIDSWNEISAYQGNIPKIITREHLDYNIIAFVSPPVTTRDPQQESRLDDCVPRLFLVPPTTGQSSQEPFGTFLMCSESGWACFQASDSVIELLKYKSPEIVAGKQEARTSDYKNVIERLEKITLKRNVSSFLGHEADSYKAGITAQVTAVGLWQSQQQDEGTSALIENVEAHERIVTKRLREELDIAELGEMKVYLGFFEWYMGKCRANSKDPGYYDSFKNARERRDNGVDKYKTYLMVYWEKVVEDAEKQPQLPHAPLRDQWLFCWE
ncbi:hypothetical protein NL676_036561 [Syzygium grande]|nr:hypothetical protein NL676_036561 [Syzygium grande]